jgi:hypothetical protein
MDILLRASGYLSGYHNEFGQRSNCSLVIPAKAGIHPGVGPVIPAKAGMTDEQLLVNGGTLLSSVHCPYSL